MFLFYLFTIGLSITSSVSTIVSYLLLKTCSLYSDFIDQSIKSARDYVSQAKGYIGQADNVTTQFLYSYNKFVDLQQSFQNSAMNQINTIEDYYKYSQIKKSKLDISKLKIKTKKGSEKKSSKPKKLGKLKLKRKKETGEF